MHCCCHCQRPCLAWTAGLMWVRWPPCLQTDLPFQRKTTKVVPHCRRFRLQHQHALHWMRMLRWLLLPAEPIRTFHILEAGRNLQTYTRSMSRWCCWYHPHPHHHHCRAATERTTIQTLPRAQGVAASPAQTVGMALKLCCWWPFLLDRHQRRLHPQPQKDLSSPGRMLEVLQ